MKCHDHPSAEAVAVCVYCGRGLCAEHAVFVGKRAACKGRCEAEVRAMELLFQRSRRTLSRRVSQLNGVYLLAAALIFLYAAAAFNTPENSLRALGLIIGGILLLYSLQYFQLSRRLPEP